MDHTTSDTAERDDDSCDDVIIVEPVPIRFGFVDVLGGDIVARYTKYKEGQGGAALADYLEAFSDAIEATKRLREFDPDWLEGALASDLPQRIKEHLRAGDSIVDAPDMLGESFARIVAILTRGQPSVVWTWEERKWIDFEVRMTATGEVASSEVEREFGVTRDFVTRMARSYYGTRLLSDVKTRRNQRLRELFELDGLTNPQMVEVLREEGYGDVTIDAVKKQRQRWRKTSAAA